MKPTLESITAGRIALTFAEAQSVLRCPYEAIVTATPKGWVERMGWGTIPVAAVTELAKKLGPFNE
jgi:hypothetical protein